MAQTHHHLTGLHLPQRSQKPQNLIHSSHRGNLYISRLLDDTSFLLFSRRRGKIKPLIEEVIVIEIECSKAVGLKTLKSDEIKFQKRASGGNCSHRERGTQKLRSPGLQGCGPGEMRSMDSAYGHHQCCCWRVQGEDVSPLFGILIESGFLY